jgi:hypothetical protein
MAPSVKISDSEFAMWRAVFAFSLVDNMLSMEEQGLLRSYLNSVPFSPAQLEIIKADFMRPQNVEAMYKKITEPAHKKRFCVLARALVWCEGDMDLQEAEILRRVACIKGVDEAILRESRDHPNLENFHQKYAKAGLVGLMKTNAGFQMHA